VARVAPVAMVGAVRRPLLAVAVSFGLGCLLSDGEAGPGEAAALLACGAGLLVLAWLAAGGRGAAVAVAAASLALGAASAAVESLQFERSPLRRSLAGLATDEGDRVVARLVGRLRGDAAERAGRLSLVLDVETVEARGQTASRAGRARVEIGGAQQRPALVDGDRVAVWVALREVEREEGVRAGLEARGFCKSTRLVEVLSSGGAGWVRTAAARVRQRAREAIARRILPGPERGLVLAMTIGDRSEIDDRTADTFRASGTYHVLALSGAQVALVAGLLVALLRFGVASPWTQALVTSLAVGFYALLVGGDVPVLRAALMAAAVLAGRALELDTDVANLLGLAALGLLAARPAAIHDVGFQLSFGATLGILALVGPLTSGVPRLPLRADLAVAASVAAQAALAPVLAAAFHRMAPAAVVLNLAAVPLSSAVLLGGLAVVALDFVSAAAAGLAGDIAWIAARALRASADLGPLAPWLDLRVAAPSLATLALHACGLAWLARGRRGAGLGLLAASHLLLLASPLSPRADGRLRLTVIDVGQGDSLLLQSPSGRALLVDAGGSRETRFDPGERRVAPQLWQQGLRRLDALLVTHAHPDHVGGAPFVLRAFRVASVWEGPAPRRDPVWRRVDAALGAGRASRLTLAAGMRFDWDGVALQVLGPARPRRPPERIRNEDSVVLDVAFGEVHFLLTGDVVGESETWLQPARSIVLKVPHHGSRSSSSAAFLAAVRPRVAFVSAGAHNPFGHPHPEVLLRYRQAGVLVLRTDRDGTLEAATDGRRVWVRTAGEGLERRIR
jgi:competence protein ComEC